MNYLIIENNTIVQICSSPEELLKYLKVTVTDKGIVKVGNIELPTSYSMIQYTHEEILQDILRYQLKKIECLLQIGIYKLERI